MHTIQWQNIMRLWESMIKAVENQLKAYDYATFSSPYQIKLREYSRKANNEELVKNIEKLQSDMQDAILKGDKEAFKKFTHPDITDKYRRFKTWESFMTLVRKIGKD